MKILAGINSELVLLVIPTKTLDLSVFLISSKEAETHREKVIFPGHTTYRAATGALSLSSVLLSL